MNDARTDFEDWPFIARAPVLALDASDPVDKPAAQRVLDAELGSPPSLRALRRVRTGLTADIARRNLRGVDDCWTTLESLSAVADALIQAATDLTRGQLAGAHGEPRGDQGQPLFMGVLGMGKLGGGELNFSSDVDLIFVSSGHGETVGNADGRRKISSQEFFQKQAQACIDLLARQTSDGFVYRVDARLRPFGSSGALVVTDAAMEQYYEMHGRAWERYALMKARAVVDHDGFAAALLERLNPFIYRRHLDYTALGHLRGIRRDIADDVARKEAERDLKRGAGGIREAEFVVQALQMTNGGAQTELQTQSWRHALDMLVELGHMQGEDADDLRRAYVFLRQAENRTQAWDDRQTHDLPDPQTQPEAAQALAASFDVPDMAALEAIWQRHVAVVTALFDRVVGSDEPEQLESAVWRKPESQAAADWAVEHALPADAVRQATEGLREHPSGTGGAQRLQRLWPRLLAEVASHAKQCAPEAAVQRLARVLGAISGRTAWLALLDERPDAARQLVRLVTASPALAATLAQNPALLDELLDPRTLFAPPDRDALELELAEQLSRSEAEEDRLDALRDFQRRQSLRVAAAELTGALSLMRVSDYLSTIAEVCLQAALAEASAEMAERHGVLPDDSGLCVAAYGKLGGLELNYGSDLDLVFLHDSADDLMSDGRRPLAASHYWIRLVQRITHWLTTRTGAGRVYEVDTRLRPSGNAGLLVTRLAAFAEYQSKRAWTWEHQALVRARAVVGAAELVERFGEIRRDVLQAERDRTALSGEVHTMREKLRERWLKREHEQFDLKQSPGAIMDLEFLVQYLVLAYASENTAIAQWSDNVRQIEALGEAGILDTADADGLRSAYLAFRGLVHQYTLAERPTLVADDQLVDERERVQRLYQHYIGGPTVD